jgi:hypothetical protein
MDNKIELEILLEIEKYTPPEFTLLPDVKKYDKDLILINCFDENRPKEYYASIHDRHNLEKKIEYLKNFIDYKVENDLLYFEIEQLREYLNNKVPKSVI